MKDAFLVSGLIPLHILHHAAEGEIYGQAMMDELLRHGYRIGPGTMYPMLHRLEERGYLKSREERNGRIKRLYYRATQKARAALRSVKPQIAELFAELLEHSSRSR